MPPKIRNIEFKLLEGAKAPTRGTEGSAGWDLYSRFDYTMSVGDVALVDTGVIAKAPPGHHFKLLVRSGLATKKGITMVNSVGIIDEDYWGPSDIIIVPLIRLPLKRINVGPNKNRPAGIGVRVEQFSIRGAQGKKEARTNFFSILDTTGPVIIQAGERFAQLLIEPTPTVRWIDMDLAHEEEEESRGGFGSTGS